MENELKILGLAGSLRRGSYNRSLLTAAAELMPAGAALEIFSLEGFPLYNQDLEPNLPDIVRDFKARIRAADAILIATPEYNYSVPGVLKNAIDWASRPSGDSAWDGKPAAIMSASTGMLGGSRAQYHLRQSFVTLNMFPLNKPELIVTFAPQKFDEQGHLTDAKTRELTRVFLECLLAWTLRLKVKA
jgi:chromate reductase, NAD(P)H dehydrogenase (quinone)